MSVDDVEFRDFYAAQYARLCWLGLLLTGDQAEAEELAQEALVRTWWRWVVHRPNDPAAYARKVLVNRRRSLLRRAGVESRFLARTRMEPVPPPGDEQAMVLPREHLLARGGRRLRPVPAPPHPPRPRAGRPGRAGPGRRRCPGRRHPPAAA
jgi:DNA-directed RNA polymerase specialized sigma24 family protein